MIKEILSLCIIFLLLCTIVPISTGSIQKFENENIQQNNFKTIYLKADCQKIILYKPITSIVHIGPLWFTSELAYLAFIIDKEFTLKLDGQNQNVNIPAMVIPYKFIGLGPLFWIQTVTDPCNRNVTLVGWCEDVVIHPMNTS